MPDQRLHYIYAMSDPETGEVRYIGKTLEPQLRFRKHLGLRRDHAHMWSQRWIRTVLYRGVRPVFTVIEFATEDNWAERESHWIRYYRERGHRLTNLTDGGEGTHGWNPPPEYRAKRSAIHKALWQEPEFRSKTLAARKINRWSRNHDACIECGTAERRHASGGLCVNCYNLRRHRTTQQPDRPYHEWAWDYPACIECGTTERPHKGHGMCENCLARHKRRQRPPKPQRWARDYDQCLRCGRTDRGHHARGLCHACDALARYRSSRPA